MRETGVENGFIFESELVRIGRYRCTPWASVWREENQIRTGPLMVFPSRALRVEEVDSEPVVASTNTVVFHNRAPYRRWMIDERGEDSVYVALAPGLFASIVGELDPRGAEDPENPFRLTHAPVSGRAFLAQRRIARRLIRGEGVDVVEVEETMLELARELFGAGMSVRGEKAGAARQSTKQYHRELARAAEDELARSYRERLTLSELARRVHSSAYHLARVFRAHTGMSLHEYQQGLRLRAGLVELERVGRRPGLGELGLSLGYSSHAHFTTAFRRHFGVSPSAERAG